MSQRCFCCANHPNSWTASPEYKPVPCAPDDTPEQGYYMGNTSESIEDRRRRTGLCVIAFMLGLYLGAFISFAIFWLIVGPSK